MNKPPDFKKAETYALKVLDQNFITSWPVPVKELVEFHGLGLILSDFSNGKISGVIDLDKKYLYINSADSSQRRRFTIAHELGHWVLHQKELSLNKDIAVCYRLPLGAKENDRIEKKANCFAANLLIPKKMLCKAIANLKNPSDAHLAKMFNVSQPVVGYQKKLNKL